MSQLKRNPKPIGAYVNNTPKHSVIKESNETEILPPAALLNEKDYKKYKTRKALKHLTTIDTRDALRPYKNERLGFEGVLIEITQPNKKNQYSHGLVFASLYSPDRKIELDHVVMKCSQTSLESANLELFTRYYFTAEVGSYRKTINLLGIPAQQEHFMLCNINMRKITPIETSKLAQPSQYIVNRINNVMATKHRQPNHTERELYAHVHALPNDGTKEQFIEEYARSFQSKKMTSLDVVNTLYKSDDFKNQK